MAKSRNPRRIIKVGLLAAFVLTLAILLQGQGIRDFAAIAYPPIPEAHYEYINMAAEHCKIPRKERPLLAALAWKESTFNAKAQSGAGAKGVTQVLSGTALGVANKYQIGGLNAQTIFDAELNYKLGACYLSHNVLDLGDGTPASWDNPTVVKGALIAYNAGPARGKSFVAGAYNGPTSSLGYADRIMQAEQVYALDFRDWDLKQATQPDNTNLLDNVREGLWKVLLGRN